MLIVPHGDRVAVRLPFFCSVRVHVDEAGRLRLEPYFALARGRAAP